MGLLDLVFQLCDLALDTSDRVPPGMDPLLQGWQPLLGLNAERVDWTARPDLRTVIKRGM